LEDLTREAGEREKGEAGGGSPLKVGAGGGNLSKESAFGRGEARVSVEAGDVGVLGREEVVLVNLCAVGEGAGGRDDGDEIVVGEMGSVGIRRSNGVEVGFLFAGDVELERGDAGSGLGEDLDVVVGVGDGVAETEDRLAAFDGFERERWELEHFGHEGSVGRTAEE